MMTLKRVTISGFSEFSASAIQRFDEEIAVVEGA